MLISPIRVVIRPVRGCFWPSYHSVSFSENWFKVLAEKLNKEMPHMKHGDRKENDKRQTRMKNCRNDEKRRQTETKMKRHK
jgi:hypothetical protein